MTHDPADCSNLIGVQDARSGVTYEQLGRMWRATVHLRRAARNSTVWLAFRMLKLTRDKGPKRRARDKGRKIDCRELLENHLFTGRQKKYHC